MERQVSSTVYSIFGMTDILDDIQEQVIYPHFYLRYCGPGSGLRPAPPNSPPAPKMILISGPRGCGHCSIFSVLVNELRRGRSNKRGDVHYSNRDVKFLEWNSTNLNPHDLQLLFDQAKQQEFTVLTIPYFDHVFPLERTGRMEDNFRRIFIQLLTEIPVGKILVVAGTFNESSVHAELMQKIDYKYVLTEPDEHKRAQIFWGMLEYNNCTLSAENFIDDLVRSSKSFRQATLAQVINGAIRQAKRRQHQNTGRANGEVVVIPADWARFLEFREEVEEEDDDEPHFGQIINHEPIRQQLIPHRLVLVLNDDEVGGDEVEDANDNDQQEEDDDNDEHAEDDGEHEDDAVEDDEHEDDAVEDDEHEDDAVEDDEHEDDVVEDDEHEDDAVEDDDLFD